MQGEIKVGDKLSLLGMDCVVKTVISGGMGMVYICREMITQMLIVFKTYRYEYELKDQFSQETEIWVRLGRHDNIVNAIGSGTIDDRLFIALEYVEPCKPYESSLRSWIRKDGLGRENSALILDFAIQICNGLIYARDRFHQEYKSPFVHRDIKPDNVLVSKQKIAKVTDFGLVWAFAGAGEQAFREAKMKSDIETEFTVRSEAGFSICGTPAYMAPEVWLGKEVDERADIYSFGCMLYEMIAGHTPFSARDFDSYREAHLNHEPASIEGISDALNETILRCLKKDRSERYLFFDDVISELTELYREETGKEHALEHYGSEVVIHDHEVAAHAYITEGLKLHDLGNLESLKEAIRAYDKAIEIDHKNPEIYYLRGKAYRTLRVYRKSIEDFDKAIELNPRYDLAFLERGLLYRTLGVAQRAKDDLHSFIRFAATQRFPLKELVKNLVEDLENLQDIDPDKWKSGGSATTEFGADTDTWSSKETIIASPDIAPSSNIESVYPDEEERDTPKGS